MEVRVVLSYVGKKVRIVLKNDYNYTAIIPPKEEWGATQSFSIKDKFGESVDIDCSFIAVINVLGDNHWRKDE